MKEDCPYNAYVKIKDGQLISGMIDKAALGEGKGKLISILYGIYGPEYMKDFFSSISKLSSRITQLAGITSSLDEYDVSDRIIELKKELIKKEISESENFVSQYRNKTLPLIPGKNLDESFEGRMLILGESLKSKLMREILFEKALYTIENRDMNTVLLIVSGARGKPLNLVNISGFWGQVSVRTGRPLKGYKDRVFSSFKKKDLGAISHGFIVNSFMDGFSPKEYFFHAMGGRIGIVDTGVSTRESGYFYRRLANALQDYVVEYDGTVRGANRDLIQFTYGGDSLYAYNHKNYILMDPETIFKNLKALKKKYL